MKSKVKLFVNENQKSKEVEKTVREELEKNQFQIVEDDFDLGIAIGGDGTFLRMIKDSEFNSEALYVGINAGTLGFAQEVSIEEVKPFIDCLRKEEYHYEKIAIGEASVKTDTDEKRFYFLNEMLIRHKELKTTGFDVQIENHILEEYVGDGLLISTSFGSTAYNLSFGGSIVYNTFHTLQITPIAPINNKRYHALTNSVIIPSQKIIKLTPNYKDNNYLLTIDGDNHVFEQVKSIDIAIQQKTINVIRKKNYNFIDKINDKFMK